MVDLREYPWTVTLALFVAHFVFQRIRAVRNRARLPLPPGPKGYPIVGNLFDVAVSDASGAAHHYSRLAQKYGKYFTYAWC
jgi:hypothetical protein